MSITLRLRSSILNTKCVCHIYCVCYVYVMCGKVFPQAMLMVAQPFKDGNCGGRRLNQYTITMEIMFTSNTNNAGGAGAIGMAQNNFGGRVVQGGGSMRSDGNDYQNRNSQFANNSVLATAFSSGNETGNDSLKPIFSTSSYGETEVFSQEPCI